MTFLNASLIFGALAAAVPIVLHLLARREPRKVVFPSVRFLVQRFESNRSRLRVRRWWLLALRIAALVLLALALARPAIHQSLSITWLTIALVAGFGIVLLVMASIALSRGPSRTTALGLAAAAGLALLAAGIWSAITLASGTRPSIDSIEPVSIAIVLDNSPTSAWHTADDDRIARMKDVATWMVTRLPRTSRIAVIDRSAQVATFSLDASSAVSKIDQLQPLEATQPITARLEAAARLVRTSDLPNRQVLLITDLAASTWGAAEQSGLASLWVEDPAVSLTVFDLGEFEGTNRSLSVPQFADNTPPRDSPVALSTTLSLPSAASGSDVSVTAELEMYENDAALPMIRDGVVRRPELRAVDRASVRIAAGGSSQLLLTIPSLAIGTHHGRIRLIGSDAMPLDDTRYISLEVLPPAQVLLVGDDADDARVMAQALVATAAMIDESNAEFAVEQVGFSDLSVVRLADFDVVAMLDPPRAILNDDGVARYLNQGGSVLVGLGPGAGEQGTDSNYVPKLVRRWRVPEPGTFFQVTASKHAVTEPLSRDTPWSSFRVQQYWQLEADPSDAVLMQYAGTTHPALIERTFPSQSGGDRGLLLVLSTPLPALSATTRSWNQLFGSDPWPAWLLCRQSIEHLARRGNHDLMPVVGQSPSIGIGETVSADARMRIQLFPPGDGSPIPLEVPQGADRVTISDVSRSGTHWLRGLPTGAGFSANLPQEAIDLQRVDGQELDAIFGPDQYTLATNLEGIEFAENKATQRVSLHSPAILLALAVFVLEQILGNRFYRGRAK